MHHFQAKRSITYSFWARVKIVEYSKKVLWFEITHFWEDDEASSIFSWKLEFYFNLYLVFWNPENYSILIFTNLIPSPSPIRIEMLEMRLMINDFKIRYFHQINRNDWKQFQFISLYHFSSSNHFWLAFWNSDQDA